MRVAILLLVAALSVAVAENAAPVFPVSLDTQAGTAPTQPLSPNLSAEDQGNLITDDWNKYVQFKALYEGLFTFNVPAEALSGLTGFTLMTNVKASAYPHQKFLFYAKDHVSNSWTLVGDNNGSTEWEWFSVSAHFDVDNIGDYIQNGQVVLKMTMPLGEYDPYGYVDCLALQFHYSEAAVELTAMNAAPVFPVSLNTKKGTAPTQPLSPNLSAEDQGNLITDDWNKYVQFKALYRGLFTFNVPDEALSGLTGFTLMTNVKSSAYPHQKFLFHAKDYVSNSWKLVGDNNGSTEWEWFSVSAHFDVDNIGDYVKNGKVLIKMTMPLGEYDPYGYVDCLALQFHYMGTSASTSSSASTSTESSATSTESSASSTESSTTSNESSTDATSSSTSTSSGAGSTPTCKTGTTWSNLAWGWNSGGKDAVDGYTVVDVDLFDTPSSEIASLRASGHIVICYFSVGTKEDWRSDVSANQAQWDSAAVGDMAHWDEAWLDVTKLDLLKTLMGPRMDLAVEKGCHGVEPDNIDCYDNSECRDPIGSRDYVKNAQVAFNQWQTEYAHSKGLLIAMKNALDIVATLEPYYDMAMNEECYHWNECDMYAPFFASNKLVMNVEYTSKGSSWCNGRSNADKISAKWCDGSASNGICKNGEWVNCFDAESSSSTCSLTCNNGSPNADCSACTCSGSWTGSDCLTCGLGCVNGVADSTCTQCTCHNDHFTGSLCDSCTGSWSGSDCHTCSINCNNGYHDSTCSGCVCSGSWSGPTCETCSLSCANGSPDSTCTSCVCSGSWTGADCSSCSVTCSNGGHPNNDCNGCVCFGSWTGSLCSVCAHTCHHGSPNSQCNGCDCEGSWTGDSCSTCSLDCGAHGSHDGTCVTCICSGNWSGHQCSTCALTCGADEAADSTCTSCVSTLTSATSDIVAPYKLTTMTGTDPQSGQPLIPNLTVEDQGASHSDDWNKFIQFEANYAGLFEFHVPSEAVSGLTSFIIRANVKASAYPYQKFNFYAKNANTGAYEFIGDSVGAAEWTWSMFEREVSGSDVAKYVSASHVLSIKMDVPVTDYDRFAYMDFFGVKFMYTGSSGSSGSSTDSSSTDSSSTDSSSTDSSSTDSSTGSGSTSASTGSETPTATETSKVIPNSMQTVAGSAPSTTVANLYVNDQGGSNADAWGKMCQFQAYYAAHFEFTVPSEARSSLSGFALYTNVKSSRYPYQTTNFYIYNFMSGAFELIGDNDDSTDWVWFDIKLDYSPQSIHNYVDSSNNVRIKFEVAKDDYDAYCYMDYINMAFYHSGTAPISTVVLNQVHATTGDIVAHATCYNSDGSLLRADGACRLNVADLNSNFPGSFQNGAWNPASNKLMFTTFKDAYNVGFPYIRVFDMLTGETETFGGHLIGVNMPGSTNSWSPDDLLLYAADINYGDEMYCHDFNDKSGTQVLLTKTGMDAWEPSFSSDGKWAVFEGGADKVLYLTDTNPWHENKVYTPLTSSTRVSRQPVWSANGKYITYQAKGSGESDSAFQVMVIDVPDVVSHDSMRYNADTFTERVLTDYGTDCSFSPAGDWIVYSGNHHQGPIDAVYVVPVAGGDPVRVTEHDGYDGAPGWSPDGCYIVTESSEYAPGSPPTGVTPRTDLFIIGVPAEVAALTCNTGSSSSTDAGSDGGVSTGGTNSASEGSTNSDSSSSSSSSSLDAGAIVGWFSFGTVSGLILTSLAFVVAILVVKYAKRSTNVHMTVEGDIEAGPSKKKMRRKGAHKLETDDAADWDDDAE